MDVFKLGIVFAQDAAPLPPELHISNGFRLGVFEFVILIILLSFIFKVIKLHYESLEKKQSDQTSSHGADLPQVHSALNKEARGAQAIPAAYAAPKPAAKRNYIWAWLLFGFCCVLSLFCFILMFLPPVYQSLEVSQLGSRSSKSEAITRSGIPEAEAGLHEAPEAIVPEVASVSPKASKPERIQKSEISAVPSLRYDEAPDDFLADVYPSIADCGAPMAIKVYNELSRYLEPEPVAEAEDRSEEEGGKQEGDKPKKVSRKRASQRLVFFVINDELSDQDFLPFLVAFRKKMKSKIENCDLMEVSRDTADTGQVRVSIRTIPNSNGKEDRSMGRLVCEVSYKAVSTEVITNYVERQWLTDMEGFAGKSRGKYLVGHSGHFFASEAQALNEALNSVLDSLGGDEYREGYLRKNGKTYGLVDQLIQKYERPYGDVFRCAVLLQKTETPASERQVTKARRNSNLPNARAISIRSSPPSFEWFVAMLIGMTVVIGTVSNVLTQGYYRTEISRTVIFGVVAGVLFLISVVVMALTN